MKTILVTGASGLIGSRLVHELKSRYTVLAMSRHRPDGEGFDYIRGDFACWEDLAQLDDTPIDTVVHLAAVTGGCIEREGILVNVEGSRVLMQYLAGRGCKKMILASSIAAIGFQHTDFIPEHLPITEQHGCLDRNGYGLSKYLMEEVSRYISRQKPDLDILNIRLAAARTDDKVHQGLHDHGPWCLGDTTYMVVDDAVELFILAVESPLKPGLRIVNGVASRNWATVPTADQLRHWWGDKVDVSYFEQPGNEYASVFDTTRLQEELGFEATRTLELLAEQGA